MMDPSISHRQMCRDCIRPSFPDGYCYQCNTRRHNLMQEIGRQRRELRQMERDSDDDRIRFNRSVVMGVLALIGTSLVMSWIRGEW